MTDPHLTLEQKIGQLFVLGFQGREPAAETRALFDLIQPGGFLLYKRNIDSFDQIYDLTTGLRRLSAIPPFVAIDHEGGRVDRLKHIFAIMPSMAELAGANLAYFRLGARIIAAELEATGFNLDLAPIADLRLPGSIVKERALAAESEEVGRLAAAFTEELARRGILTCAKHFPGLGAATVDPHFVLPHVERTKRQIQQEDAAPFVKLFNRADMMMISHAHYHGLGDEKSIPASLSPRVVDGFLRKKLGYTGLTITDDLTMGAVSSVGLTPELFLRAFEAGNDLLLFSQTTPLVERAFNTILRAARKSAVLRHRVDESIERIMALKGRIEFIPLRYRAHLQTRITRQIEKLRKSLVEVVAAGARAVPV
jgi:beta-N-acetylhexosaminidase